MTQEPVGRETAGAGFLLAGGQSRRFGQDKRRALLAGVSLARWAAQALRAAVGADGYVSAVADARHRLPDLDLPWLEDAVLDGLAGRGPLGPCAGLLAAARHGGGLVLACDMPLVPARALTMLRQLARGRPAAPHVDGRLLPLSAYWPAASADALEAALRTGGRVRDAFRAAGGVALSLADLGLDDRDGWLFTNVNTGHDLQELAREAQEHGGIGPF